jgi:hypothetical protein
MRREEEETVPRGQINLLVEDMEIQMLEALPHEEAVGANVLVKRIDEPQPTVQDV